MNSGPPLAGGRILAPYEVYAEISRSVDETGELPAKLFLTREQHMHLRVSDEARSWIGSPDSQNAIKNGQPLPIYGIPVELVRDPQT